MLERDIEAYLVKRCEETGIHRDKFSSPGRRNVPDDILIFRSVVFLELKAPGRRPNIGQARDHERRRAAGASVYWTDSKAGVDAVVGHMLNPNRNTLRVDGSWKVIA
jgi:hypothetical protein